MIMVFLQYFPIQFSPASVASKLCYGPTLLSVVISQLIVEPALRIGV